MYDTITSLIVLGVGGYIGAVADRFTYWFHVSRAFVWHTHCPHCFSRDYLRTYLPLLGHVLRRGTCIVCRERLPILPFVMEALGALISVSLWWLFVVKDATSQAPLFLIILTVVILGGCLVVAASDALYDEVPLIPYVLACVAVLMAAFITHGVDGAIATVAAGAVAGVIMVALYLLSSGKWVHSHDVLIGVLVSLIVGWPHFLVTLAFAYMFAIIGGLLTWGFGARQLKGASSYGMYLFVALAAQGVLALLSQVTANYASR